MPKYILQSYKEKRKVYPYEETTAYYYGPKESWMKEVKDDKKKIRKISTNTKSINTNHLKFLDVNHRHG